MQPYDQESEDEREEDWREWLANLPEWQFNAVSAAERQRAQAVNPLTKAKFLLCVSEDFAWYSKLSQQGYAALAKLDG